MATYSTVAIKDAAISFFWVFFASCIGAETEIIAANLGLTDKDKFYIMASLLSMLIIIFSAVSKKIGGACWNPIEVTAFSGAGLGDTAFLLSLRVPAQAVGSAAGALAINQLMPSAYKATLGGPMLEVGLLTGVIVEGLVTFIMCFVILWAVVRGPANENLKSFIMISTTIVLIKLGSGYTGPSMNPANSFAWAYTTNTHNTQEHFWVYWFAPLVASLAAGQIFKRIYVEGPKEKTS